MKEKWTNNKTHLLRLFIFYFKGIYHFIDFLTDYIYAYNNFSHLPLKIQLMFILSLSLERYNTYLFLLSILESQIKI